MRDREATVDALKLKLIGCEGNSGLFLVAVVVFHFCHGWIIEQLWQVQSVLPHLRSLSFEVDRVPLFVESFPELALLVVQLILLDLADHVVFDELICHMLNFIYLGIGHVLVGHSDAPTAKLF